MGLVWGGEGSEGMLRRGRRRSIGTGSYFATSVLYVSIDFCTLSVHRLLLFALPHIESTYPYFYHACYLTCFLPCELVVVVPSGVLYTRDCYVGARAGRVLVFILHTTRRYTD